jgi:hypothetical protein
MQFQKLTGAQRAIKRWRGKRNSLVCKLLAKNPHMSRSEALREANRQMGPMPRGS